MRRNRKFPQSLKIFTDGAIRPEEGVSGLAAIARDEQNQIFRWWYRKVGRLTCNEAEYAAAIFALDQTLHFLGPEQVTEVAIFSDSRVMVAKAFCALVAQKLRSGKRKWPKVQVLPLFLHILTVVFCIAFLIRLFHVVFKGFETQIGRVCPVL